MNKDGELFLSDIPSDEIVVIAKVHGHGGFRHRILEMGFVRGQYVRVVKNAPLLDPIEYQILDGHISLRRSEAHQIEVVDISKYKNTRDAVFETFTEDDTPGIISKQIQKKIDKELKTINCALVGNPNCGKTSFFNFAAGQREKVGNYSGVTVSAKHGVFKYKGYTINLVDLPGTYSITEYTPEEMYVREYLVEQVPDIVLNIIDASNLERNLFLTSQLIDLNVRMVGALNMYDELISSGNELNYKYLGQMLGFPIVPSQANKGKGINNVLQAIIDVYEDKQGIRKHIHIKYGNLIEEAIYELKDKIKLNKDLSDKYCARYLSIKLLEGDSWAKNLVSGKSNSDEILEITDTNIQRIMSENRGDETETVIADAKYSFIRGALKETFKRNNSHKKNTSEKIDDVLTNKWLGFPILIIFLAVMFEATFKIGIYPQRWIELGVSYLAQCVRNILPTGILSGLLADGIISGVGGVLSYLPNILILFFFISLMEDTGYMARATFIMDKFMHKIGLHGRSFIPLLTGFGCSVPAIMATRTLENKKDRLLTMFIIPFMSCSAKLPVYILLVSQFFDEYQGLILLGIYATGILFGILTALMMKKTLFKKASEQFVMELPPYRVPTMRNTLLHMWNKSAEYLNKIGSIILIASVIIWALNYFPQGAETSYLAAVGRAIAPIFSPIGFDWKMTISLLTGIAAKETIVSSLEILTPVFTPLIGYAYIMFILLYSPCIGAITTFAKESSRKWTAFMISYTMIIAWLAAYAVVFIGGLFV
ncbi:MAG: ferrous iron transport protein B [Bacteroidales bacterium]